MSGGVLLVLILYFIPAIVAGSRGHPNSGAISALNLLLGWTFVGWVAAFVWSLTAITGQQSNVQRVGPLVMPKAKPTPKPFLQKDWDKPRAPQTKTDIVGWVAIGGVALILVGIVAAAMLVPIHNNSVPAVDQTTPSDKDVGQSEPVHTAALITSAPAKLTTTIDRGVIADLLAQRVQCRASLKNLEHAGTVKEVKAENGNVWAYYDETAWNALAPDDQKSAGFTIFCATMPTSGKQVVILLGLHQGKQLGKIVNGNWTD